MKRSACIVSLLVMLTLLLSGCGCKHEHTEVRGAVEATCTEAGATGDTYCLDCQKIIKKSKEIPALGHDEGTIVSAYEPSCSYEGYTGDLVCTRCGALLKAGESIPMTRHVPGNERVNVYPATCTREGYTGDICCDNCGECLEEGEAIPRLDHVPGEERVDVREATCTREGYTGDVRCVNCGELLEEGEIVPMLPHQIPDLEKVVETTCTRAGYTGEGTCSLCEQFIKGETLPMLDHTFDENGTCTVCGWKTPGLYMEDQLVMSWDELVSSGYITVSDDSKLVEIGTGLTGTLVVSEEIDELKYGCGSRIQLSEIWMPRTVTTIAHLNYSSLERVRIFGAISLVHEDAFEDDHSLQSVEFLNPVDKLDYQAFDGCEKLTGITLPEGLQTIASEAFRGCSGLEQVNLPQSLREIGYDVFEYCSSLKQISLPEGLIKISGGCFENSGLTSITVPSTVEEIGSEAFSKCSELTCADLSACKVTKLEAPFSNDPKLTTVLLPATLNVLEKMGAGCESLNTVELPEGVTTFSLGRNNAVSTIVWPESLLDGKGLKDYSDSLTTIYYRGSEMKWGMVANKGEWADRVTVICDYDGTLVAGSAPESTEEPTPEPTEEPTPEPTEEPAEEPTEEPAEQPTPEPADDGTWTCENGHEGNTGNFCPRCGAPRPEPADDGTWTCENGHEGNTGNFCPRCGAPRS